MSSRSTPVTISSRTGRRCWLDTLFHDRWSETSDLRRLAADLDWDPYYGDRRRVLASWGSPWTPMRWAGCSRPAC
jgi:hypothetical protein